MSLKRFFITLLVLIIFFFFISSLITLFISLPVFRINKAIVEGNNLLSSKDVLQFAKVPYGEKIFLYDFKKIRENILQMPAVLDSRISRKLPDTLKLIVIERKIIAVVLFKGRPLFIDKEGIILNAKDIKLNFPNVEDLPVIVGLNANRIYKQEKYYIEENIARLLSDLISRLKDFFDPKRIQIDVSREDDIVLWIDDLIKVKFGDTKNIPEKVKSFYAIYARAEREQKKIEYIDVRFLNNLVVKFST